jgi:hypothetical protein
VVCHFFFWSGSWRAAEEGEVVCKLKMCERELSTTWNIYGGGGRGRGLR